MSTSSYPHNPGADNRGTPAVEQRHQNNHHGWPGSSNSMASAELHTFRSILLGEESEVRAGGPTQQGLPAQLPSEHTVETLRAKLQWLNEQWDLIRLELDLLSQEEEELGRKKRYLDRCLENLRRHNDEIFGDCHRFINSQGSHGFR